MVRSTPHRRIPPIGFAHRGARAHAPENTIESFRLAIRLGATGLESDAWITADGVPVLDHDGIVKTGLRKRAIRDVPRDQLPSHIPTLEEFYNECGTALPFSIDIKDPNAYAAVVSVAQVAGGDAERNLWLCDPEWERLAGLRAKFPNVQLVDSTRLKRLKDGPERHAARLADVGIDAVNMHYSDWTGGLIALFHRFDRTAFGWDAQHERMLSDLVRWEIDGLYCDDVERMMSIVPAAG